MKLLIIDDEPLVRRALKRLFPWSEVHEACNGLEAWSKVEEAKGDFDVIFCDMTMPILDGLGFFQLIEKSYPEQAKRVVFQTGGSTHSEWLETQAQPVVPKPYRLEDLKQAASQVVPLGSRL
jgi:CheY-like chemotaxis protein